MMTLHAAWKRGALLSAWLLAAASILYANEPREPAGLTDEITVTATRTPTLLSETPASVAVLTREALEVSRSPALDDALRSIPGFTLFRRSGSRTANPTSQGVSLRGVGASGASRTLVLDDGIPLNDPFGGWIYWGRIPRGAVDRIEVLRGGASDLYGGSALAGVIHVLRSDRADPSLSASGAVGSHDSRDLSLFAAARFSEWQARAAIEAFTTGGYTLVPRDQRGPVDTPARSERLLAEATLQRDLRQGAIFARLSAYTEERDNGTALQSNATDQIQLSLGADLRTGGTDLTLRAFGMDQDYEQSFSSISADRQSEQITRLQDVPSESAGASITARLPAGGRTLLIGGVESRMVRGTSREQIFGAAPLYVENGGEQQTVGAFLEALLSAGERWGFSASARGDTWTNRGRSGGPSRGEEAFSPRLAATHRLSDSLIATASAYRSFRAPTLNELYRPFRVGNVLTLANESLRAESLSGVEGGLLLRPQARVRGRLTLFSMEVEDPIANVTLAVTPALITRQRQNIGRTRSRGVEVDAEARVGPVVLSAGLLHVQANVRESDSGLAGLRVPQVPRNQATLGARYRHARGAVAAVEARWSDEQFDDDRNTFRLDDYLLLDAFFSYPVRESLAAFLALENLLDEAYEIGRTPVVTLGQPRSVRLGLTFRR
jgi:outer membrane receptor protein involved in Fe transport